jgi:hypothetical protein
MDFVEKDQKRHPLKTSRHQKKAESPKNNEKKSPKRRLSNYFSYSFFGNQEPFFRSDWNN